MHWILDNLQLLIFIAGAVAWWLNQRMREKAGERADYDADGTPEARPRGGFEDAELAERTRRIREEIGRKIAERRRAGGGYAEPARTAPASLQPPVREAAPPRIPLAPEPPPVREVVVRASRQESVMSARRSAEILEQQAAMAGQLQQAVEMKAAAQRRMAYEARVATDGGTAARTAARGSLLHDLNEAGSLRRAFVLREVLGPPVGLR